MQMRGLPAAGSLGLRVVMDDYEGLSSQIVAEGIGLEPRISESRNY